MLQFGAGHRVCIGKNISYLEVYKVVPELLRRFEVCYILFPSFSLIDHAAWLVKYDADKIKPDQLFRARLSGLEGRKSLVCQPDRTDGEAEEKGETAIT